MSFSILTRKRGGIKHKLTNFSIFLQSVEDDYANGATVTDKTIMDLKCRLENFEQVILEFERVQDEIEAISEADKLEEEYQERDQFTNKFWEMLSSAKLLLCQLQPQPPTILASQSVCPQVTANCNENANSISNNSVADNNNYNSLQNVKLPTINLPIFDGDINKWLEFKDTFMSLIETSSSLSSVMKFHYLKATLKGEPLKIIQTLEFSAENYKIAWEALCNRFDSKRLLVFNHVRSLFNLEHITRESASSLRYLIDNVFEHLKCLNTLGEPTDKWDSLLIYLISTKLDKTTVMEWERQRTSNKEVPTLAEFQQFLKFRAEFLETINSSYSSKRDKDFRTNKVTLFSSSSKKACNYCSDKNHVIYSCTEFLKLSVKDRIEKIKQLKLCKNCLCTSKHEIRFCKAGPCKICKKKHSSLLHLDNNDLNTSQAITINDASSSNADKNSINLFNTMKKHVLLSTALIYVFDKKGNRLLCKAILDSGSQSHFISQQLCDTLDLQQYKSNIAITGINNVVSSVTKKCTVMIQSRTSSFKTNLSCFVMPTINDTDFGKLNKDSWNIPSNLKLSDPDFHKGGKVDLLIGASLFWELIINGKITLGKNKPIIQNTLLGWVVAGIVTNDVSHTHCYFSKQANFDNLELQNELRKFWEVEECNYTPKESPENIECENYFKNTYSRNDNGRFVVRIPLKESRTRLGDSQNSAVKQLLSLEHKLQRNPSLRSQYTEFLEEYELLGHMSKINHENDKTQNTYYLPHHCVIRDASLTTKLRVVFNGSAPTTSGVSLNDLQHVGPQLLNDLFSILIRFRQHNVVVCADIEKMYRQILIHPDDRPLQRIVWRSNAESSVSAYELNTVVYGTASAPYLAVRCLKQVAINSKSTYPSASARIDNDFYMDDLITGFSSEEDAISVCKEISAILKSFGFSLRKWISNYPSVLEHLRDDSDNVSVLRFSENESAKTLGIQWNCNTDSLTYHVDIPSNLHCTKRSILSTISKLYDPLGLLCACIILAKILIQRLWMLKSDWDDNVPDEIKTLWLRFSENLILLNGLQIPRQIFCSSPVSIQLHGFSDASQDAYCACIYMRTINSDTSIYSHLVCAKAKVSPLKPLTIPRLELLGALLLARLVNKVIKGLSANVTCYYWCDSKIVLSWLNLQPRNLQIFVSNRVSEIQEISNKQNWNYVCTKDNPADLGSRGVYPHILLNADIWWKGPHWLSKAEENWPFSQLVLDADDLPETKRVTLINSVSNEPSFIFKRFSTLTRLKRVIAYCLRFTFNAKSSNTIKIKGNLSINELNNSMNVLLKLSQLDCFRKELKLLASNSELKTKGRLLSLSPFIDDIGLMRVGGRLKNSNLNFSSKHPILLDSKHPLTVLIMTHEHLRLLHASPQMLLVSIRQVYWPISGMNLAKKVVRNCLTCFKHKPQSSFNVMGDLPKERVTATHPFNITGVDYAGPFLIKEKKSRCNKLIKCYICLFVCFSVKAIHLELVSDLTTEGFLASFKRFVSRRGLPSEIWSDNATNFVGAARSLKELSDFFKANQNSIITFCTEQNIKWKFIPSSSPHFGGLWESNIKSVKQHLLKIINNTHLTYDEFYTLIVQIEAILNSRPLFPMSSDPNDLSPLTPSHFLIGKPLIAVPDPNLLEIPPGRLSRFQLIQQLKQSFWKRWSKDYLAYLQQRNKWMKTSPSLNPGTMVLLKEDHLPPSQWALGRIVKCYPGQDGVVRVVDIKTCKGTYRRAIIKVCPLPVNS